MVQGQTSALPKGASSLLPLACAGAGCALAAGLSLLWLAWIKGGLGDWDYLLPSAVLGALCGFLAARLLPLRRETKPAWLRLCMHCHAVNPDSDQTPLSHDWTPVDQYLEKAFNIEVSHGICPHCMQERYGQKVQASQANRT